VFIGNFSNISAILWCSVFIIDIGIQKREYALLLSVIVEEPERSDSTF